MPPTIPAVATEPIFRRYKDCLRFRVQLVEQGLGESQDLFFDARTTATGESYAIRGTSLKILFQFIATDANGLGMQSCDFSNLPDAAMPSPSGFAACNPTPLLFVQATEDQIEKSMILFFRMITRLTCRASTLPNRAFLRHHSPPSLVGPECYHIISNHGIDLGQVLIVGFSRSGRFVGRLGRPKQEFPWKGKIRTALPIVAGGNTAAIHVFCDSED